MNNLLAQHYTVTMALKTQFTIRAMSKDEVQAWLDSMVDNERFHISIEIEGSDVDWIVLDNKAEIEEKQW